MQQPTVYISLLFLLIASCGQVDTKTTNVPQKDTSTVQTISPPVDGSQDTVKSFEKTVFDIHGFINLTDSLLTSIDGENIRLNFTVDSNSTTLYTKKKFDFDPGKGHKILRLWVEFYSYNDKSELEKHFKKLQKDGSDQDENNIVPGLTYTNDYVIKSDKYIVWLNTGCSYAYFNHQKVKQILFSSLNIGQITDSIICVCGGSCK